MAESPDVERLRLIQEERERQETQARQHASDPDEARAHERRAEKAAYLRGKLEQQAEAADVNE